MITQSEFESISIELADSSEAERNKTYERIRKFAKEQPDQFKQFLSEFPLNEDSALFEVFEALGANGDQFLSIIIYEVERLLDASSNPETKIYPCLALGGFHNVEDSQIRRAIQNKVLEYYESDFKNTRRTVISLILDGNYESTMSLRKKVEKLSNDSDWRVRVLACKYLNQSPRILDKIKTKLFDPYWW